MNCLEGLELEYFVYRIWWIKDNVMWSQNHRWKWNSLMVCYLFLVHPQVYSQPYCLSLLESEFNAWSLTLMNDGDTRLVSIHRTVCWFISCPAKLNNTKKKKLAIEELMGLSGIHDIMMMDKYRFVYNWI